MKKLAPKVVVPGVAPGARAMKLGRDGRSRSVHSNRGAGDGQLYPPSNLLVLPRRVSERAAMPTVPPACMAPPGPPVLSKKAAKRRKKRLNQRKQKENGPTTLFYYTVSRPPFVVVEN